jgi:uridine kinase
MPSRNSGDPAPAAAAARQVIDAAARWRAAHTGLVIAIDGHGAAGKSTIAGIVADLTGAALVRTDDYFIEAAGPAPGENPGGPGLAIARYYDWDRLRAEALEPLRAEAPGPLRAGPAALPSSLIVVEGVTSAAPAFSDLVDRSVFVDTPLQERMLRLRARVRPEDWDDDWLVAEQAYFDQVRPLPSFDLVVSGAGAADGGAVTYC